MANEREAVTTLAPFHKFTYLGQALAGFVHKASKNDNGEFIVFRPALLRHERGAKFDARVDEIAVGLTTDLGMKIDTRTDVNKFLVIEFHDQEPSTRGQPKKIFRVIELSREEMVGLRDGTFTLPEAVARKREPKAESASQNDLPF